MELNRYTNQVAIVTGGADGLGKSIASRLHAEGARVVLFDINEQKLGSTQAELGGADGRVDAQHVDVADEASVKEAVAAVAEQHGRIDVMVNCAGIVGPTNTKTGEFPTEGFDEVIAVNLRGTFLMTKYTIEQMLKRDYGRILLIASISGKEGNAGMVGYSTSKAGVIGLVKATAKEYTDTGITINGLAPAVIRTAMVDACAPEQVKYMTDKIPMKRTGTVEEVAAISSWIVSNECSFTTGFTFDLSGGRATY